MTIHHGRAPEWPEGNTPDSRDACHPPNDPTGEWGELSPMLYVRIRTESPDEEIGLGPILEEDQLVFLFISKGEGSIGERSVLLRESQARQLARCLLTAAERLSEIRIRNPEHRVCDAPPEQVRETGRQRRSLEATPERERSLMYVRIRTKYAEEEICVGPILEEDQLVVLCICKDGGSKSDSDRTVFLRASQARQLAFCLLTAAEGLSETRTPEHRVCDATPEQVRETGRHLDVV